jgi:hypothetical protein
LKTHVHKWLYRISCHNQDASSYGFLVATP